MKLIIIGASGHGKVVADIAKLNGYDEIEFLDDDESRHSCGEYPVVGKSEEAGSGELFVAIGNALVRKRVMEQYKGRVFPTLIHPKATIAGDATIGEGTVIMAGAVVNPGVVIGKGVIVNTCSSIDHDCIVADYVHISVGAHLCGTVKIDSNTWIGAGAIVSNNIKVCKDSMIGAGAVVINDIDMSGTYVGIPARRLLL